MQQRPQCLQDGKVLVRFYILRPADKLYDAVEHRYWLEYYVILSSKILSPEYHLVQPTEFSQQLALRRNLIVYTEWIPLFENDTFIHGPFDFATRNGRQTRDRISSLDWELLKASSSKYDNDPPQISKQKCYFSTISWNQPIHTSHTATEVSQRVNSSTTSHHACVYLASSTATWKRYDNNAQTFKTSNCKGPSWKTVYRRQTFDMDSNQEIENIPITLLTSDSILHRQLPHGVMNIKTVLYYRIPQTPPE